MDIGTLQKNDQYEHQMSFYREDALNSIPYGKLMWIKLDIGKSIFNKPLSILNIGKSILMVAHSMVAERYAYSELRIPNYEFRTSNSKHHSYMR